MGKVALGLGRMLGGIGAKEARNSVRGWRRYNGAQGHAASSRPPPAQGSHAALVLLLLLTRPLGLPLTLFYWFVVWLVGL